MCNHKSIAKKGAQPYPDGTYFVSDMECKYCGRSLDSILGMTQEQIKKDREYTDKLKLESSLV